MRRQTTMNDWNTEDGRRAIIKGTLRYLLEHPDEFQQCLIDDDYARDVVATHGATEVPAEVKVVFTPQGDLDRGIGCSLIIEVPPLDADSGADEILRYSPCTYFVWADKSAAKKSARKQPAPKKRK